MSEFIIKLARVEAFEGGAQGKQVCAVFHIERGPIGFHVPIHLQGRDFDGTELAGGEFALPDVRRMRQPEQGQGAVGHELATNAAKYGALSVPEGHVHVEWSRTENGRLYLRWTETGDPPVRPPMHKGVGTRVMKGIIEGN